MTADDLVDISRATSISEAVDYVALSYIISNIDDDQFKDNFNFEMNFSEAVKKASELGIAFDHEEFGFIFFDADRTNCNVKGFDTLFGIGSNSYNIKQSIVSNVAGIENKDEYKYSYARVLFDETEGMNFDIAANREVFVEDVIKYIYGKVPTGAGAYDAIIATGYSTVVLDKPLTEHDMELAEKLYDDPEYAFSEEEVKDCADTDRDGLFDFEEVMFYSDCAKENEFIKFKNGNIELPQVADIMRIFEVNGIYAYVDGGVEEARKQYGDCWAIFLTEPVLPIVSDPTSEDGDKDSVLDINDSKPLLNDISTGIWQEDDEDYSTTVQIELLKLHLGWLLAVSDIDKKNLEDRANNIREALSSGYGKFLDEMKTFSGAASDEFAWFLGGDVSKAERDYWLYEVNKIDEKIVINEEKTIHTILFIAGIIEPSPDDAWRLISKKASKEMLETVGESGAKKFLKSIYKYARKKGDNGIKYLGNNGIKGYKYEVKIMGKGGAYRLLGNRTESGEIFWEVFEKTHK